jgi:hypothetical protein
MNDEDHWLTNFVWWLSIAICFEILWFVFLGSLK